MESCKLCEKVPMSNSLYCSDECFAKYITLCQYCRKRERVHGRFCSVECQKKYVKRITTPRELRPLCKVFSLNNFCPAGEHCWDYHPIYKPFPPGEYIILQCSNSHIGRIKAYLEHPSTGYDKLDYVGETRAILNQGVKLSNAPQLLFYSTTKDIWNFAEKLKCDQNLARAFDRIYVSSGTALRSRREVLESVKKQLVSMALEENQSTRVRIFGCPRSLEKETAAAVTEMKKLQVVENRDFRVAIFVVEAVGGFYLSVSKPAKPNILCLSKEDRGGEAPREFGAVSRAFYKLSEVLRRTPLKEWAMEAAQGEKCSALDVGSAPGGWSYQLAALDWVKEVVAVDPGAMAAPMPQNVTHLMKRIEDCREDLEGRRLDLYVNDMNCHPEFVLKMFYQSIDHLNAGAAVCLTLKAFGSGGKKNDKKKRKKRKKKQEKKEIKHSNEESQLTRLTPGQREICQNIVKTLKNDSLRIDSKTIRLLHLFGNGLQERNVIFRLKRESK